MCGRESEGEKMDVGEEARLWGTGNHERGEGGNVWERE